MEILEKRNLRSFFLDVGRAFSQIVRCSEQGRLRMRGVSLLCWVTILLVGTFKVGVANGQVKAFPTAEGFGAVSKGGRGGVVIRVTNLNDSGPGSLRAALLTHGPRFIVFEVSGTVNLSSPITLTSTHSNVYLAGQTSPGGVQLKGNDARIVLSNGFHDGIFRHMRIRPGGPRITNGGQCFIVNGGNNPKVYNVIIDHFSCEWGTDGMAQAYTGFENVTVQWSSIAEGSPTSPTRPTSNSFGWEVGGYGGDVSLFNVSMHHNLNAHLGGRSPRIARSNKAEFVNNVVYNWGSNGYPTYVGAHALHWGDHGNDQTAIGNFIKNRYIPGPNSVTGSFSFLLGNGNGERGGTKISVSGNWTPACPSGCSDDWNIGFVDQDDKQDNKFGPASAAKYRASSRYSMSAYPITETPTANLLDNVLATVGASKPSRDSVDARIVNDVRNRTGNIANIGNGGPWPALTGTAPAKDSDRDGLPDSWEIAQGLNPNDAADANRFAANGYTNIENYLNGLAGDSISGSTLAGPTNLQVVSP